MQSDLRRSMSTALNSCKCVLLALTLLCSIPGSAGAQQDSTGTVPRPVQLEVTPYVWGLQLNSDDQLGAQKLNAELTLGDILKSLRGLGELELVPRYKQAFVFGDGIYASLTLKPKQAIPGIDHINVQAGLVTLAAGYSFGPLALRRNQAKPVTISVQPFVGASYSDLAVTARSPALTTVAHDSQLWWMPVLGARIDTQSGNWVGRLDGDFSDFYSDKRSEQVLGSVGYQLRKPRAGNPTLNFGYRYLYEERLVSSAVLRLKAQGPLVFATFHF